MTFEDKILGYLDGSLDADARAELLHTLSVSPEKRALLEEHLRLRELMAFGHKPLNVPAIIERAMAARLPALSPRLAAIEREVEFVREGAKGLGPFAGAVRIVGGLFASTAFRAATASLVIAGGLWYYLGNGTHEIVRTEAPRNDVGRSEIALNQGAGSRMLAPSSGPQSSIPNHSENSMRIGVRTSPISSDKSARVLSARAKSSGTALDLTRAIPERPIVTSSDEDGDVAQSPSIVQALPNDNALNSSITPNAERISSAKPEAVSGDGMPQTDNGVSSSADLAAIEPQKRSSSNGMLEASPVRSEESLRNVGHARIRYQPEEERSYNRPRVALSFSYGLSKNFNPTLAGDNLQSQGIGSIPTIALDYEFSRTFWLGIEAGNNSLSRISSHSMPSQVLYQSSVYVVNYQSSIEHLTAYWSRLAARFKLFSIGDMRIRASIAGGASFAKNVSGLSPIFALATSADYSFTDRFALTLGLRYTGAWLNAVETDDWRTKLTDGKQAVGIINNDVGTGRRLFTPITDLLFGVQYQF